MTMFFHSHGPECEPVCVIETRGAWRLDGIEESGVDGLLDDDMAVAGKAYQRLARRFNRTMQLSPATRNVFDDEEPAA